MRVGSTNPYAPKWKGTIPARDRELGGPIRVAAHVHKYPPQHGAGAEWMLHQLLVALVERGHEARVAAVRGRGRWEIDGVECFDGRPARALGELHRWADVVVTHLDVTRHAMSQARAARRPVVHLIHNDTQVARYRIPPGDLCVFNSEWVRAASARGGLVVHPPVDPDRYLVTPGDRVTAVNLAPVKGGELFWRLAERLSDVPFVAVLGAYGHQLVPSTVPSNVELVANTPHMRDVYARTRLLLMPSRYESWGRVAVEAAHSGIPAVCSPTPGLRESMPCALFAPADDLDAWAAAVRRLLDHDVEWRARSVVARARADQLHEITMGQISHLADVLVQTVDSCSAS